MDYLLDTHTFLWYVDGDNRLSITAKNIIEDNTHAKLVSIVTLWEIAIKISNDKLKLTVAYDALIKFIESNKFNILQIEFGHLKQLLVLPHHHGDPFDRLIVSQAIAENISIISKDRHFESYPIQLLW